MSSSVMVPSWLDDLSSEDVLSLLESEEVVSEDAELDDCMLAPETVLVVRS